MIVFTDHARDKLQKEIEKLGITEKAVIRILNDPDEILYDALRNRFVAISWAHNLAVIHERTNNDITVITVIYALSLKASWTEGDGPRDGFSYKV